MPSKRINPFNLYVGFETMYPKTSTLNKHKYGAKGHP
jgi:hypothetical protein